MQLSPQQNEADMAVDAWQRDPNSPQVFYLAGFAGSGKTTLAKRLSEKFGNVVFAAFTGKAALVLASKGCEPASTIHSLIYKLKTPNSALPKFVLDPESAIKDCDVVVIDEVSMVGEELALDLLSFGVKVLVLGDPAQLPPVHGEGYFTSRKPDYMLTEIHRQAADNPIIRMSMDVREGRGLDLGTYGSSKVIKLKDIDADQVLDADQVIVGLNKSRRLYNGRIRKLLGRDGRFVVGERVVTLKNHKEKGLLNGGLWDVEEIIKQDSNISKLHIKPIDVGMSQTHAQIVTHHAWLDGKDNNLHWREKRDYQPVDYGYVLSCHKSQGSQWDDVLVFDESASFRENSTAWLYTAITRAAERITVARP